MTFRLDQTRTEISYSGYLKSTWTVQVSCSLVHGWCYDRVGGGQMNQGYVRNEKGVAMVFCGKGSAPKGPSRSCPVMRSWMNEWDPVTSSYNEIKLLNTTDAEDLLWLPSLPSSKAGPAFQSQRTYWITLREQSGVSLFQRTCSD